eukprot:TRINITY_DN29311_c0_g1_i1.p1 TRINITY_DN29311_c0_g1~~TRINITY_DN29311_c0_g1_i1.p1  ORF type:complete len:444 (-),score=59.72 TRINITY_DN29311_c0_g1_i1:112-1263(-)
MQVDHLSPTCSITTLVARVSKAAKVRASNVTLVDKDGCVLTKDPYKRLCDLSIEQGSVLTLVVGTVPSLGQLRKVNVLSLLPVHEMREVRVVRPEPCQTARYILKKNPRKSGESIKEAMPHLDLLRSVNSRFVLSLIDTYKTRHHFYTLLEYVPGMDLWSAVQQLASPLSHEHSAFYIGSILLAIDALEERSIVHTGIASMNLVLDVCGYPKLAGFEFARQVSKDQPCLSTGNIIGVPHYMSPESFKLKCITTACNLWSLGILAYELLCGEVPFGNNSNNPKEVIRIIMSQNVVFPATYQNPSGQALIRGLLQRAVDLRSSSQMVRESEFFCVEGYDSESFLQMLAKGKVRAPLMPPEQPEYPPEELSDADEELSDTEEEPTE